MAADNTFGQAVFRLLVDDKEFRTAFTRAVQTAQLSSKKIADLSDIKVTPPDMDELERKLQAGSVSLADFGITAEEAATQFKQGFERGVRQEVDAIVRSLDSANPSVAQHGQQVENLSKTYRDFLRQERFEDRIIGQARSGVLSLASSIAFLSASTSNQSEESTKMNNALMQGLGVMNGVEFIMFSIGNLATRTTGTLSRLTSVIGAMAGPVGIAVGAGLFFISMLRSTNEEAKKAAEQGLSKLEQVLERLTQRQRLQILVDVEALERQLNEALEQVQSEHVVSVVAGAGGFDEAAVELAKEQRDRVEAIRVKLKEKIDTERQSVEANRVLVNTLLASNDEYVRQEGRLLLIAESLRTSKDILTDARLTQEQITALLDEQERLEREKANRQRSSLDVAKAEVETTKLKRDLGVATDAQLREALERQLAVAKSQNDENTALQTQIELQNLSKQAAKERLDVLELERSLGIITAEQFVAGLRAAQASVATRAERLQFEEKIRAALKAQTDELIAQTEQFRQQNEERRKEADTARIQAIDNRFDREVALEKKRFEDETANIRERLNFIGALNEEQQAQRRQDLETLTNLTIVHERNIAGFEERRIAAKRELLTAALASEHDRAIAGIESRYALLEARAVEAFENESERTFVIAELRRRKEEEVSSYLRGIELEGINRIASALGQLGDEGVRNFARMLQIAVQIAQTLERASLGKEGGDPLSVIASFIPLIGLFNEGGEIPGGSYVVSATQSREHEQALDMLGAGRVQGGVRGKDSVPVRIKGTDGAALLAPGERIVAPRYAHIGKAINEGRVVYRASGGSVGLYSTVREFSQVNATASPLPIPSSVSDELKQVLSSNMITAQILSSMVEEVRRMRAGIETVSTETARVRDEVSKPLAGEVTFLDGKMFLRRELPGALEFERERSS